MVPIIGQAQVEEWTLTVQVKCPCGNHFMTSCGPMIGTIVRPCGKCDRAYRIGGIPTINEEGALSLRLQFMIGKPEEEVKL